MSDLLTELLKFFSKPSWRKVITLGCLVIGAIVVLFGYEHYTASFRLSRLQKGADLLASLQKLQNDGTNNTTEFKRAYTALMAQTIEAVEDKPISLKFIPSPFIFSIESLWRFVAGAALWLLLAIGQLPRIKRKEGNAALGSLLVLAMACGFVAMFVRPVWWPWFHILILPCLFLSALLTAALPISFVYLLQAGLRVARAKAMEINCLSNLKQLGLAARMWARDNGESLPSGFDSIKDRVESEKVFYCPTSHGVRYELVSPGCSTTNPSVEFARCRIHNNVLLADGSARHLEGKRVAG